MEKAQRDDASGTDRPERQSENTSPREGLREGAPLKRHGDALLGGSGTRHGVQDGERREEPGE